MTNCDTVLLLARPLYSVHISGTDVSVSCCLLLIPAELSTKFDSFLYSDGVLAQRYPTLES